MRMVCPICRDENRQLSFGNIHFWEKFDDKEYKEIKQFGTRKGPIRGFDNFVEISELDYAICIACECDKGHEFDVYIKHNQADGCVYLSRLCYWQDHQRVDKRIKEEGDAGKNRAAE